MKQQSQTILSRRFKISKNFLKIPTRLRPSSLTRGQAPLSFLEFLPHWPDWNQFPGFHSNPFVPSVPPARTVAGQRSGCRGFSWMTTACRQRAGWPGGHSELPRRIAWGFQQAPPQFAPSPYPQTHLYPPWKQLHLRRKCFTSILQIGVQGEW